MTPEPDAKPHWKQAFPQWVNPVLPDLDLVFRVRVDAEYYHSVLHHAVEKAKGTHSEEAIQAFLEEALVAFYEAQKGKQATAAPQEVEVAESLVPGPRRGQGGKSLRIDMARTLKRDTTTRLLLRRYGTNLDTAKRLFAKEAILAKLQSVMAG